MRTAALPLEASPLRTITVLYQALYGAKESAANALQKRYPIISHAPPFIFILDYGIKNVNGARKFEFKKTLDNPKEKDYNALQQPNTLYTLNAKIRNQ